ncbi:hypothetical protein ACFVTE_09925 [Arthrobacter sp. NPDC058097]|uniref:hypothetical protein n=1 Tax=Arthrobacter sp. NPDC058097 TaxID=3346340 RepID=UPI0036DA3959
MTPPPSKAINARRRAGPIRGRPAVGRSTGSTVGALFVPLAAAVPLDVALVIIFASRHRGYPAGPRDVRLSRSPQ